MTEAPLTRRERDVMDLIYAQPDLSVSEINDKLIDDSSYSSTRALLARLVAKGHLTTSKHGARYLYRPQADQRQVGTTAVRRVMDTFFGGSPAATIDAVLGFASDRLSDEEREELLQMLASADSKPQRGRAS
jgi:BlaI family penicillinase repressor